MSFLEFFGIFSILTQWPCVLFAVIISYVEERKHKNIFYSILFLLIFLVVGIILTFITAKVFSII